MKKTIFIILIILIFSLFAAAGWYWRCLNVRIQPSPSNLVFTVSPGQGIKTIAANLESAGLIKSAFCFELYVWRSGQEGRMKAGDYQFAGGLNIKEIAALFSAGETVSQEKNITIIEGWRNRDIADYLAKEGVDQNRAFPALAGRPLSQWAISAPKPEFLADAPATADLEGYLFPDTYRIFKDATAEDVVIKMLNNFANKLDPALRRQIKEQGRTIYEIVTMASIVEKEVRQYEDMRIVAGIFWDRIKNGQALESCATLAYIIGVNKPQYTQADTEIDSPYNTYENRGLPPGPISNPGLNALKAAIDPVYTGYNYFLSRPDTGETVFSATYDEHLANKAKYLQ